MSSLSGFFRLVFIFAVLVVFPVFRTPGYAQVQREKDEGICSENPAVYAGFRVKDIRIKANLLLFPLNIGPLTLRNAQATLAARGEKALEADQPFDEAGYFNLQKQINEDLSTALLRSGAGILAVLPRLVHCNDVGKEVEVEYTILGIPFSAGAAGSVSFEVPFFFLNKRKAAVSVNEAPFQIVPYLGYNGSRGLFGGAKIRTAFRTKLVQHFAMHADFSFPGSVVNAALSGTGQARSAILEHAEWRAGYHLSKIPAGSLRLHESTFFGQIAGSTRPFTAGGNVSFRYGATLERGRRSTNVAEAALPEATIAKSGYGAGKVYAGGVSIWRRHSLKASYGLQLGNTGKDFQVNYLKNIFDAVYRGRYPVADHRSLQLDLSLSAGKLSSVNGEVPAAERFFGGNAVKEFIPGDGWKISEGPFIRSIAQNRLNKSGGNFAIGGDSYRAANLSLSLPVWRRALIPDEISQDQTVIFGLGTGIRSSRLALTGSEADSSSATGSPDDNFINYKLADIQQLVSILNDTARVDVRAVMDSIVAMMRPHQDHIARQLADSTAKNALRSSLSDDLRIFNQVEGYVERVRLFFPDPADSAEFDNDTQYDIESMVSGYGDAIPAYFTGITDGIASLRKFYKTNGLNSEWGKLDQLAIRLKTVQEEVRKAIRKGFTPKAELLVRPTTQYVGRVLGVLFKELNIVSVSPVLMFDAAQMTVKGERTNNYGLGAAVRLSLVNFDVYAGYSFNPARRTDHRNGAFVLSIDITDLF